MQKLAAVIGSDMKEFCLFLLCFLLLKNLGVIAWDNKGLRADFEGTRNSAVNLLQGEE